MSRLTDRDDVVFGVTVSGRPAELAGVETMVGLFINTVPLRVRLDAAAPVGRQCLAVQRDSAILREHSYLGHAQLRAMGGVGEMYDTLLVYENFPTGGMSAGDQLAGTGVTFRPAAVESLTHFPIVLAAHMADERLVLMVEVIDGAIGNTTAAALGRRLLATADQLLQQWDRPLRDVSVLLADEAAPLGAGSAKPATAQGIHTRFAAVAARIPDRPAVTWSGGTLSYRRTRRRRQSARRRAAARGVGAETPVAIQLSRGPQYVVAILAALKAGATYVPLEPGMPAERVNSILRQSGATIVIDDDFTADWQPPTSSPSRSIPVTPPTWSSPREQPENPRASSELTPRSAPTPTTIWTMCCDRRRPGWAVRCASRTHGRSRSTRPGSRWSRCSTATSCTSSTSRPRPTPRRWSRRSPSTVST